MTSWDRRIKHIDRRVKPTAIARLGLRSQFLKAKVKERRGLPSRSLPLLDQHSSISDDPRTQKNSGNQIGGAVHVD